MQTNTGGKYNRNWLLAVGSAILLFTAIILNTKIPNERPIIEILFIKIGIPINSNGDFGAYFPGFLFLAVIILSYLGIKKFGNSVHPKFGKNVLIIVIISLFALQPLYYETYKIIKHEQKGLNSIEFVINESQVSYSTESFSDLIRTKCIISLINHADEPRSFHINIDPIKKRLKDDLKKYYNVNIVEIRYDEKKEYFIGASPKYIWEHPQASTIDFEFDMVKEGSPELNAGGGSSLSGLTLYNDKETIELNYR